MIKISSAPWDYYKRGVGMIKRIALAAIAVVVLFSVNHVVVSGDGPVEWESDSFEKNSNPVTETLSAISRTLGIASVSRALGIDSPFFEVNISPSGCYLSVSYPHKSSWFQERRNEVRMKGNAK